MYGTDIICYMFRKKKKQINPAQVIIPGGHPNPPESHEVDVAYILARHYRTTVQFLIPVDDYKRKSADIVMLGVEWEIKCPRGDSRSTISNQLRWASKQSSSIIIDTRHTKLPYDGIEKKVQLEMNRKSTIKRVILINKFGKVIEITK
jgi:hypothetical protein